MSRSGEGTQMEPEVLFEVADGIGSMTLNRPRQLNTLTLGMILEMRRHVTGLAGR